MTTVFIAANQEDFEIAVRAGDMVSNLGAQALNPVVTLPCHLPQCCYLPIELAMLEASDILWLTSHSNSKIMCLVEYALAQNITIVHSEQELARELAKYEGSVGEQLYMEEV